MSARNAIEIKHITKIYGRDPQHAQRLLDNGVSKSEVHAETGQVVGLNDVSIEVEHGHIFVVMGLSGSGKSTLIRHVNRLIEPTSGELLVNGHNILDLSSRDLREFRRTAVAMVFQNFGLLPHRYIIDNIAYGLEIRGVSRKERRERAAHWLEIVGLAGYEYARPFQLSGGQQQRVGLARALAMDTDILLMDEAFSALDPLIRSGMQDELLSLQKELRKTILFITHDFDEAIKIGDRIAVLNDGEVVQTAPPEDIILNPANDYVNEFVRDVNRARVIHIRAIMEKDVDASCEMAVPASACCEEILPMFAEQSRLAVSDDKGNRVGVVTAKRVIQALARHSPDIDTTVSAANGEITTTDPGATL